ncbi:MAG: hypothetical protein VX938_06340, partial [Myxococcota bacterium]|nr:hypothetical protein [Myxococcota bacterium]
DFVHDGNEIIFNLPNGFQAYMITAENGERLDKAPSNIVADNFSDAIANMGPEVTNGLSCISCHYSGIHPAEDIVRDIVSGYETSQHYPGEVKADVQDLYPPHEIFDETQEWDTDTFNGALADAGIPEALDRTEEPTSQLAYEHLEAMDLTEVAAAVGLTAAEFKEHEGLSRLTKARAQIGNLAKDKIPLVKRDIFDESFRDITCFLEQGQPVTDEIDNDGLPKSGCAVARVCNKNSGLDGVVRLTLDGVELEALPGKCSPCRNLPVGDSLLAEVVVETVNNEVNEQGDLVKVVEKTVLPISEISLEDSDEILLDVTAIIEGGQIVDQAIVAVPIPSTATCEDINSIEDI